MPSRFLPFWPKGTVACNNSGGVKSGYSTVFPTDDYTEIVAQLNFDSPILNPGGGSSITVYPQISVDGKDWKDLTAFNAITPGSTYPTKEIVKITDVSSFMRFRIELADSVAGGYSGGAFSIFAVGRWEDEE